MSARRFDADWYARLMKTGTPVVLACGAPGSGVRLWTRRRLLGHTDDEVLADRAEVALRIPKRQSTDDPVTDSANALNRAVAERLAEIRRFAGNSPVVLNWTTRDLGTDPVKFDAENLGVPEALLSGSDVVLYIMHDGNISDELTKCWVLKDGKA